MNWFERYGIVGMFFIVMTGVWLFCLFPDSSTTILNTVGNNKGLATLVVGLCSLGFLPIGYLIVILGQFLYYRTSLWEKIHCKYWKALSDELKKEIEVEENKDGRNGLSEKDKENEEKIESILTYYDRFYIKDIENNKFLSTFATKRYDVIAINRALTLTIWISLICAVCIKLVSINVTLGDLGNFFHYISFENIPFSFWLVIAIAFIMRLVLKHSSGILEWQIIEIGKRKLENIDLARKRNRVGKKRNSIS